MTRQQIRFFFSVLLILPLMYGCLGTRYLGKDEYLLYNQKIKGTDEVSKADLEEYLKQRPNRKIPLIIPASPYIYFYYWGKRGYDSEAIVQKIGKLKTSYDQRIDRAESEGYGKKANRLKRRRNNKLERCRKTLIEGNAWMRLGEPIVALDSNQSIYSKEQMEAYLKSKGYFNSYVTYEERQTRRLARTRYHVHEGHAYKIDSTVIKAGNQNILKLINRYENQKLIKIGDNYDEEVLNAERNRIELLLRNNGYYDFSKQYINYQIDSALGNKSVLIKTIISNPSGRTDHKVFRLDSVIFTTDADRRQSESDNREFVEYNGVTYRFYNERFSKKIMDRRILLHKDSLFSQSNTSNTQLLLTNMDIFKFVNVNYDTTGGRFVANIYTSPLKKYSTTNEIGVNVTQGLPGPFYNLGFKNRNVFNGLEILELGGRIGKEGVASASTTEGVYQSTEYSLNTSLLFPQFIIPVSARVKSYLGRLNPKTRITLNYQYTDRPEYKRSNLNAALAYTWQHKNKIYYDFSLLDLGLIETPFTTVDFDRRLASLDSAGNKLINSFKPSMVSSMHLTTTFNFNNYGLYGQKPSSFLKIYLESGGTLLDLWGTGFLDKEGLEYYKYFKVSADYRNYKPLRTKNTALAYRVNIGVAYPYGENQVLPYEKYMFSGGSNSNRAWLPRRLGLGSSGEILSDGTIDYSYERPGELLLETSIEIRQKLIGFLDGALFIDAGNVWALKENQSSLGASVSKDFLSEIALGAGIGFRFNFSFLIVRLDIGAKITEPARPKGERFIGYRLFGSDQIDNQIIYNIGIGYPF